MLLLNASVRKNRRTAKELQIYDQKRYVAEFFLLAESGKWLYFGCNILSRFVLFIPKPMNIFLHRRYISGRYFLCAMLVIVAFGALLPEKLPAQTDISIQLPDTTLQRGTLVRLPIRAVIRQLAAPITSLSIIIRYAPSSLAFQQAIGGGASLMQCATPRTDSQFVNLNLASVRVSCDNLRRISSGSDTIIMATLEFLTLASPNVTTSVSVDSLSVNGRTVLPTSPRPAVIRMTGAPLVEGNFSDGLGQNYPHPVPVDGAVFPYTVVELGIVDFALISSGGNVIREFPSLRRPQGRYFFTFKPEGDMPSGMYTLRMTVRGKAYYRGFLLSK
jgi:hypothetical protein